MPDADLEKRLAEAKAKRADALHRANRADSTVEEIGHGVQRLLSIIERLRKGDPTDAEQRVIKVLQGDVTQLRANRDKARKAREDALSAAAKLAQRIQRLRDKLEAGQFTMEDSVTVSAISRSVDGAAGYVDGIFANFDEIKAGPWKHKVGICVAASHNAMVADVEPGDLTNAEAVGWAKRQSHPRLYTYLANAQPLVNALAAGGLQRSEYGLWIAHDTGVAHICGPPCGFGLKDRADATQWGLDGHGTGGRNVDISLVRGTFL